ncbi:MAG: hypothetical protein ACR2IS_19180, partial [Nitrososphaeraceae archaeon]
NALDSPAANKYVVSYCGFLFGYSNQVLSYFCLKFSSYWSSPYLQSITFTYISTNHGKLANKSLA